MSFFKTKMLPGGRITISGPLRKKLNLKVGDELILIYKEGDLLITTPERNLSGIQNLIKSFKQDKPNSEDRNQTMAIEGEGDQNV